MIDFGDLYEVPFFDMVDLGRLAPDSSLESVSKTPSVLGPYETGLIERCETAWQTPFRQLSCEIVLTLIGQRMGLEWLGGPAIDFAQRYPTATILYSGDMTLACLGVADVLLLVAGPETRAWLNGDFGWMDETFTWDEAPLDEAKALLAAARTLATAH